MYIRKLQPCILSENIERSNSFCSELPRVSDYSTPPYSLHSLSPLPVETKRLCQGLVIYSLFNRQQRKLRNGTCRGNKNNMHNEQDEPVRELVAIYRLCIGLVVGLYLYKPTTSSVVYIVYLCICYVLCWTF